MKIKRLMTAEEGMMGMRKYSCRLSIVWKGQQGWTTVGDCPREAQCPPHGAAVSVCPTPSPAAGAPGSVAYEVLLVPSLEISGLCEASESEVHPSVLSHIPDPSVHKTGRQLGRRGQ